MCFGVNNLTVRDATTTFIKQIYLIDVNVDPYLIQIPAITLQDAVANAAGASFGDVVVISGGRYLVAHHLLSVDDVSPHHAHCLSFRLNFVLISLQ